MGSKKGRHLQSWVDNPPGCFCKCLLHIIEQYQMSRSFRGNLLKSETLGRFKRLVPFHQRYWPLARTDASIYGRPLTTKLPGRAREHPANDPRTEPYMALAFLLFERDEPWSKEELDRRLAEVAARVASTLPLKRRTLSDATKQEHIRVVGIAFNGMCPCCGKVEVVKEGQRVPPAEFDHYYTNQKPDLDHTWLICQSCNQGFANGRLARDRDTLTLFHAYQIRAGQLEQREAAE